MRKIFSILCAIALLMQCIMVCPVQAQAAEVVESGTCGENLTWTLDDEGTLTISGTGPMEDQLSYDFPGHYREDIKCVIIEEGITSVCSYAFVDCANLTSIIIPDSVINIFDEAIVGCENLVGIWVDENNPYYCSDERGVLFVKDMSELIMAPSAISGGYTVPSSVYTLEQNAFSDCVSLTAITIPDSVTSIGDGVFSGCSNLTSVSIPDSVTTIGVYAFSDCASLTAITIPDSVTSIDYGVFSGCSNLASVSIPDSVTTIGEWAFGECTSLTAITIPDSVPSIGDGVFSGCSNLASVSIPDSVTTIGEWAFSDCVSLTAITIPDSVTSLGVGVFSDCSNLTSVSIPDSVTTIGTDAFSKCKSLTEITIPDSVISIGHGVFSYCDNLTSVTIADGVTTIGDSMFQSCYNLTAITIPDSVTSIGDFAFNCCVSLTAITIPDSVTSIGHRTFEYCYNLTSVSIPDSVTSVGEGMFNCCCNLTSVSLPESATYIGDQAFMDCYNLTAVSIPDNVSTIGAEAFSGCISLTAITIPASVEIMFFSVFTGCENLTEITFVGDAPLCVESALSGVATTCYYPAGNDTWNKSVFEACEGDITWIPYGAEVVIPTITGKSFSLSFEDEILVNFYYTVSDLTDVVEQGMLVFYADPGTVDIAKADDAYVGSYVEASGQYIATTDGIAAKEMGDDRYYCAYAKLLDGSYAYSKLYQYSPKKYAMNMLGRDSTSDKQKAICVAMLNYGTAAQEFFGYKTDDLMNAGLTDEQQAMVATYDASYFTGTVPVDASKIGSFAATSTGFSGKNASVSFEGALAINYYFTPSVAVAGDLKLYVWTPEAYAAASELTFDNVSAVVAMELQPNGSYWGQASGIAAKSLDDTYYVAGVYTDADGNTYCTGVIAYSLSRYCMNNAKPGKDMQELAAATAMYGYYAKAYFS